MAYTISTHNGTQAVRNHNIRTQSTVRNQTHIDPNGHFEIWKDQTIRSAYKELFGDAVRKYNDSQTRKDRKIKSYYSKIKNSAQMNLCYEMIIAVGNYGNKPDPETAKAIMKEFVDGWEKRNPNLHMCGAYYHADEEGVPHVHIDYIPVAHGYKYGPEIQPGMNKALNEMGFESQHRMETAQSAWQKRENKVLEDICTEYGLIIEHPREAGRRHIATELFKMQESMKSLEAEHTKMSQRIQLAEDEKDFQENELEVVRNQVSSNKETVAAMERKKSELMKEIQRENAVLEEYRRIKDDLNTAMKFIEREGLMDKFRRRHDHEQLQLKDRTESVYDHDDIDR